MIAYFTDLSIAAATSVVGVLGGFFWWFVWWYLGIPALSVLPVVVMLGFVFSCIVFYLPISFEYLSNNVNFWSAFASCWLVLPVLLIPFTRFVSGDVSRVLPTTLTPLYHMVVSASLALTLTFSPYDAMLFVER